MEHPVIQFNKFLIVDFLSGKNPILISSEEEFLAFNEFLCKYGLNGILKDLTYNAVCRSLRGKRRRTPSSFIFTYDNEKGISFGLKTSGDNEWVNSPISVLSLILEKKKNESFTLSELSEDGTTLLWVKNQKQPDIKLYDEGIQIYMPEEHEIEEFFVPDTVKVIGPSCFSNMKFLRRVLLPEGVIELCDYCFADCPSLLEITLPDSIEKIGTSIFENCYCVVKTTKKVADLLIQDKWFQNKIITMS